MVVAIAFCLVYLVTQHRAFLRLVDQESTRFIPGTFDEVLGAERFRQRLPDSITLTRLEPVFWGNDRLASLASRLTITDRPGDQPRRVDVALSDKSQFGPFIVYQANAFGVAFDLELLSPEGGMSQERLFLPYPAARDKAGYGEKTLKGGVLLLKGKFYADAELKGIRLSTPLLILRLYRGGEFLGETRLTPGTSGAIGPYVFKLAQAQWWTSVLLDGSRGMSGIFAGFALLLAGVLGSYCLVPREVIVREEPGGVRLQHLVRRFAPFYREEFDDLIQAARQKGES
jgi:hypothetical protein